MRRIKHTAKKTLIWATLLSAIYALIGEILFQIFYYHDDLLNLYVWFIIMLSIFYTLPVVNFFNNRYWYSIFVMLFFYFIFAILFLFIFGELFPITDDNPAGGILLIMIQCINFISIVIGITFGLLINLILHYRSRWLTEDVG
ncbi:hypothetical protein B2K_07900 [Paenibacillus mucilaginosus K02]|uniref:Permease n=1 Tax=Paenibacillus mucilaginosus K02 TaxID=997761 RepID=I0BE45_9BACL|nr:hypothetical protein B2K_07900 [Paenibacillus mucilaginosus K02]